MLYFDIFYLEIGDLNFIDFNFDMSWFMIILYEIVEIVVILCDYVCY